MQRLIRIAAGNAMAGNERVIRPTGRRFFRDGRAPETDVLSPLCANILAQAIANRIVGISSRGAVHAYDHVVGIVGVLMERIGRHVTAGIVGEVRRSEGVNPVVDVGRYRKAGAGAFRHLLLQEIPPRIVCIAVAPSPGSVQGGR